MHRGWPHHLGLRDPALFKQWCGFFYVRHGQIIESAVRGDLQFFCLYPRRLENLTICRCHYKGSSFVFDSIVIVNRFLMFTSNVDLIIFIEKVQCKFLILLLLYLFLVRVHIVCMLIFYIRSQLGPYSSHLFNYSCLFSIAVALLLSAASINQEEADRLVVEVTAEVKSEESTKSVNKTFTTKSTTSTKKASNAKDSTSKPISNAKFNGRTVTKKTTASSRPTAPGRSPVTGRKNPSVVSMKTVDCKC